MISQKTTIYIAENSEKIRNEMNSFLKDKYTIVGMGNDGEEALKVITENKVDVLIMDVVLSGIDGFMLMDEIKAKMGENAPKIIVTSSLTHEGFVAKALTHGAAYYMIKPIKLESVEGRIQDVVNSRDGHNKVGAKVVNKALEEKISNIFITVGIPAHIKGYQFLREAIKMSIDCPEIINSITKRLYPAIAEKFETSASKVERAIRHAIEVAWNRGKIENINTLFGLKVYSSNEKPTNGEFIALVADKMIIEAT